VPIDLVAVNLYPFARTVARPGCTLAEGIEQIDVGGPALMRAAAKNHASVAVLVDPSQYQPLLEELRGSGGQLAPATRQRLAIEAFRQTARYDAAIGEWLAEQGDPGSSTSARRFPALLRVEAERLAVLRYGENPHQAAAFYRRRDPGTHPSGLGAIRQLHGPELSYNNLLDCSAAFSLLVEFDAPAAVVVKHTNPCGAAVGPDAVVAFQRARASDPVSIYGGIVGVNRSVDVRLVEALSGILIEILLAPVFEPAALDVLRQTKKKLRVLEVPWPDGGEIRSPEIHSIRGGLLVQDVDEVDVDPASCKPVTRRAPTEAEWRDLRFAWRVAKHVKSNAIVLAADEQVLGVGAGQMSRVDAARLAVMRAREHGHTTAGATVASDAFFPFRDGLDVVAAAGATAVIQPGGSIRDDEVVAAADERGMAMVLTGVRHFRH
jgi:phosphoribosylaminoimidazolecarboxamide formyltransferase/IMP cyclohydrolase